MKGSEPNYEQTGLVYASPCIQRVYGSTETLNISKFDKMGIQLITKQYVLEKCLYERNLNYLYIYDIILWIKIIFNAVILPCYYMTSIPSLHVSIFIPFSP